MESDMDVSATLESPANGATPKPPYTTAKPELPRPDMSVLDGGRRPAPALPLEMFGEFWSAWVMDQADILSTPRDFVAYPLLSAVAAAIGNSRAFYAYGDWEEPAVLWTGIVGNPSTRKTPAVTASRKVLAAIETDMAGDYPDTLRRWEADKEFAKLKKEQWQADMKQAAESDQPPPDLPAAAVEPDKPGRPRLISGDATMEALAKLLGDNARGLLCWRNELSGWLDGLTKYNKGGSDRSFWLEAYDGKPYVVDRAGRADPLFIDSLTLSITGGIQPDKLVSLLMQGDDDGLCARFLLTFPEPVAPKMPNRRGDFDGALRAIQRLHRLQMGSDDQGKPKPVTMPLSQAAAMNLDAWQRESHQANLLADGLYASHLGKLDGLALRLAGITTLMQWAAEDEGAPPEDIGARAIDDALDFIDGYAKPMGQRVYGDAALSLEERMAKQIAKRIKKDGLRSINARRARREWGINKAKENSGAFSEAIQILCEAHWLFPAGTRQGGTPGQQSSDFNVNPRVLNRG